MQEVKPRDMEERRLGTWEKCLTLWVAICIAGGTALGRFFPQIATNLSKLEVANVSIPIAVAIFLMIYPIMVQISFEEIKKAARSPKPIALTLVANWGVKPFTIALFAWLFLSVIFGRFLMPEQIQEYRMGHTLVMTGINSLSMVVLYAPLAVLLLGIVGIRVPWETIAISVSIYIIKPLIAGYITRSQVIKRKGIEWFQARLVPHLGKVSIVALLAT
jgi:ACR3 family arsenite transporter